MVRTQKFTDVLWRRTLIISERSATWLTQYNLYYFFLSFQQSQPLNIKGIQLTHGAYLSYHIHQAQME